MTTVACTPKATAKQPKAQPEFHLCRVYSPATGECLGYGVRPSEPRESDGSYKAWYQVHCDHSGKWHCTCDGNAKWHRTCEHIKAVKADCAERVTAGLPGCWQGRDSVVEQAATVAVPQRRTARLTVPTAGTIAASSGNDELFRQALVAEEGAKAAIRQKRSGGRDAVYARDWYQQGLTKTQSGDVAEATAAAKAKAEPQVTPSSFFERGTLNGNRGFSVVKR